MSLRRFPRRRPLPRRSRTRVSRQASALAHTLLADLCALGATGIDWNWALVHMVADLRRTYGEEYILNGITHPVTHVLDLAFGYWCTSLVARRQRDRWSHRQRLELALSLLTEPALDQLVTDAAPFAELPDVLARLAGPHAPGTLCQRIDYPV